MKNQKLSPLEKERLLDQEEIIDFYYIDKESHTKILVHDKRKIKVALMEMDEYERKLKDDITRNECRYNQRTDDPIDETQDFEYQASQFELDLEDALQEACNKISEIHESSKKISKIFKKHFDEFSPDEIFTVFLYYYLDFSQAKIAEIFNVNRSSICREIKKIEEKLKKYYENL